MPDLLVLSVHAALYLHLLTLDYATSHSNTFSIVAIGATNLIKFSPHGHWHKGHRVVAEDIDDFEGNNIASGFLVGMCSGFQF